MTFYLDLVMFLLAAIAQLGFIFSQTYKLVLSRFQIYLVVFASAIFIYGCHNYGQELKFNNGQLFYTAAVSRVEAQKLGQYLVKQGFFDGKEKSVQLNKSGNIYEFKIAVPEGYEPDSKLVESARQTIGDLSRDVFNSAPVEIHLCDERLNTIRVIRASSSKS